MKAVHQNTLAVLNKLAKERKEFRDAICCVATQGLMSREESTPVSYTHLDVYKRQVLQEAEE